MAPLRHRIEAGLALTALLLAVFPAGAETDRSAAIRQVAAGETLAERSSASFDQIKPVAREARGRVDQIDPSLATERDDDLDIEMAAARPSGCVLTPEQQAIVTSLQSQGRLPAGECEMLAFFADPDDKSDDRRGLAEAIMAGAPELAGHESEAARQARLEEEARREAEAGMKATVSTFLLPAVPVNPGQ